MSWRDLFDLVIVSANKPRFFSHTDPIYHVVDEARSLLRPHYGPLESGHVYFGGNARLVEQSLGLETRPPLYVGDHLFGDVHVTKDVLRWRTALIARELEPEILDAIEFTPEQARLEQLMVDKEEVEKRQAGLRLERQHRNESSGSDRGWPGSGSWPRSPAAWPTSTPRSPPWPSRRVSWATPGGVL